VSTKKELDLIPVSDISSSPALITAEATIGHLFFSLEDYKQLGTKIKVNPAIKSLSDRDALRKSLTDNRIFVIGTDHAPHLISQKQGGSAKAVSGMPMIQFSLVSMLELVDKGILSLERLVQLMAHNPALLFEVRDRGFIRPGYKADLVIVRPDASWTLRHDMILSKCGWSPLEGHTFSWRVEKTLCNGHLIYNNGVVNSNYVGQPIQFR
jgi:dihydroorotase